MAGYLCGVLCVVLLLPLAAPLQQLEDDSVADEYIIKMAGGFSLRDEVPGAKLLREYSFGSLQYGLIKIDPGFNLTQISKTIELIPNRIFQGFDDSAEGTCYGQTTGRGYWGLTRISHRDLPDYDPNDEYLASSTGQGVNIYILDTGVNVIHNTFESRRGQDGYTVDDLFNLEGRYDLVGHGTNVAGLAAGLYHGTAKEANVISVKVLDQFRRGTTAWILEGLEWVSNIVNETSQHFRSVINLSFGLYDPSNNMDFLDEVIRQIPAVAVAAAGNEDDNACHYVPARFASVITIAATTIYDTLPSYTNYGPCVDVLAPGHNVVSASHRDTTSEAQSSGTSMAAGFVSGVVARHLEENYVHQPTTDELRALLQDTSSKNKTNAGNFNTADYLLYASCPEEETSTSASFMVSYGASVDAYSENAADKHKYMSVLVVTAVGVIAVAVFAVVLVINRKKTVVPVGPCNIEQEFSRPGGPHDI